MFFRAAYIAFIPILASSLAVAQTCTDDDAFEFVTTNSGVLVNCDWLTKNWKNAEKRISMYCGVPSIKGACSNSCSACPCEDTSGFEFTVVASGEVVGCNWFGLRNTVTRTGKYCIESGSLYNAQIAAGCIASCGLCTGGDVGTLAPTGSPIISPSDNPTSADSTPSATPTRPPSPMPSPFPTLRPTNEPSDAPSEIPSEEPSIAPSSFPSDQPSEKPSTFPSDTPSEFPSDEPSIASSNFPSDMPSTVPSSMPSDHPSEIPSDQPSLEPSGLPSDSPTNNPSSEPSISPTNNPTSSIKPSPSPSTAPIESPTITTTTPTKAPAKSPTAAPVTSCSDNDAFEFVTKNSGVLVDCDWLTKNWKNTAKRISMYCTDGAVLGNCLASCDNCSCAADSVSFKFTVVASGMEVGCDWFGTRNTEDRKAKYCVESGEYYDADIANTCVSGCFCG